MIGWLVKALVVNAVGRRLLDNHQMVGRAGRDGDGSGIGGWQASAGENKGDIGRRFVDFEIGVGKQHAG